ncbi:MAG: GNAT family N-acetyltransferase [Gammaproteobacteria bacterium]|nr:GNAT family N-acetyltransferase [Gammaproteobacteria bacterium]
MQFICYTNWLHVPDSASELFGIAEENSVFLSREWFQCLTASPLDDGQQLVLACVVRENQVMALLPLASNAGKNWYSLKHQYSPNFGLLLSDDCTTQVLQCLAKGLRTLPLSGLLLEPVTQSDHKIHALKEALTSIGFQFEHHFRHYNWRHKVEESCFEEYLKGRPAKLRNTITRKSRKLQRDHSFEIRLFTGRDVLEMMQDYYRVYSASWKSNEQRVDFVDRFVDAFSQRGWTRLAILYVKNTPVAAQIWFVHNRKASIFRLAYDEAWKHYSTGSILTSFLMQYVIDVDRVSEIDFLTGNDAYKQDWMSERREFFAFCFAKQENSGSGFGRIVNKLQHWLK